MARRKGAKQSDRVARYEIAVSPRGLPRLLAVCALVLVLIHIGLSVWHYRVGELPWLLRQLFDVDQENNLPTWFSGLLLWLVAALCWACARQRRASQEPWAGHWSALALGFLALSLDEIAGVHESINSAIVITWAIPAAAGVLVLGVAFVPFLLALPRRTAGLFVLAGTLYVAGALGAEIVGNEMVRNRLRDTLQYKMSTAFEESLELSGAILFLATLLRTMASGDEEVRVGVRAG